VEKDNDAVKSSHKAIKRTFKSCVACRCCAAYNTFPSTNSSAQFLCRVEWISWAKLLYNKHP